MDIMSSISAISTALDITKKLRDLDVSLSSAEAKAQLAELYSSLADAKIALADVKVELQTQVLDNKQLRSELDELKTGRRCPKCNSGKMTLIDDRKARGSGGSLGGVRDRQYKCTAADSEFVEECVYDPHGILSAQSGRR